MTATAEKSIEINVPVHTAYAQWTQFETFPEFMEGVVEVHQLADDMIHWKAKVGGREKEWDAQITDQQPDQRIAWRSVDGAPNAGVVTFQRLDETNTKVMLHIEAEPDGFLEEVGDKVGVFDRRVEGDLKRFKEFVESRGSATGSWQGQIPQDRI